MMPLLLLALNPSHSTLLPLCWSNPVSKASTLIPLDPTKTTLKLPRRVESRRGGAKSSTGIERDGCIGGVNEAWLQRMLQLRRLVYGMQRFKSVCSSGRQSIRMRDCE